MSNAQRAREIREAFLEQKKQEKNNRGKNSSSKELEREIALNKKDIEDLKEAIEFLKQEVVKIMEVLECGRGEVVTSPIEEGSSKDS